MQIDNDNPHRHFGDGYVITYWKGDSASGYKDADKANVFKPNHTYHVLASFKLPEEKHDLEQLRWLLSHVFEAGKKARSAELRALL